MTNTQTMTDLAAIEASTEALPLVGYTLFWRLAGLRVKHQELVDLLDRFGFKDFAPDPPTPRKALRRALEAWIASKEAEAAAASAAAGTAGEGDTATEEHTQRTLIRVINRAKREHLVFALVAEDVNLAQLGLSYATDLRILLEKKTGAMVCTTTTEGQIDALTESQRVASELQPFWAEYRELHIAGDLSEMVIKIVTALEATALRRSGGLYFATRARKAELDRLRQFVAALPHTDAGEPFVCALGVPDTRQTKRQMAQALHAGIMDEVGSLFVDLSRFMERSQAVREETIKQRLALYRRVKVKAQVYADVLEMNQEAVKAAVARLEAQARALLLKDDFPAEPEPRPAPATDTAEVVPVQEPPLSLTPAPAV